jgi:NTE family protein
VARLDAVRLDAALGEGTATAAPGDRRHAQLLAWLDDCEAGHAHVLLDASRGPQAWTERCLAQADTVLAVAEAGASIPKAADRLAGAGRARRIELVLIHSRATRLPSGTRRWLEAIRPARHHHLRSGDAADALRLARLLDERAVSLALSGGAARGFAHLGVLEELGRREVAVDAVYGTSMGSVIGAAFAMEQPVDRIASALRKRFVERSAFDYRMPLVSGTSGRRFDALLEELFGDADVEDLWRSYGAVACDLGRAARVVLDRGPLRTAVRASSALTGILPPVVIGDRVLVDGAFLDNLPADVALERTPGRVIAVNVIPVVDPTVRATGLERSTLGMLAARMNPFAGEQAPTIVDLMMRSFFLPSVREAERLSAKVDLYLEPDVARFGILEMKAFDGIVEAGRRAAREGLARW